MSKRADYDCISKVYDIDRIAAGSDVMCAMMQLYSKKSLKDMRVLDAGCGTGNYAKAYIKYGLEHITLLDASSGMLEIAKMKLADDIDAGTIDGIFQVSMPPIPFPDKSFDAVTFNVVLNHQDKSGDDAFPRCVATLKEARRVLRSEGVILISTLPKSTVSQHMWTTHVDKSLGERYIQSVPSLEEFEDMFYSADITCMQKINILGADIFPNYYKYPESNLRHLLDYVNATDAERNTSLQTITELKQRGELQRWIKENDNANTAGLLTILVCKAGSNKMMA